jgi:hypothetical protein
LAGTGVLSPRPAVTQNTFFALQPFYEQRFLVSYKAGNPQSPPLKHNEWTAAWPNNAMSIGRVDLAHLRCCDCDGTNEISVLMRYVRLAVDFQNPADNGSANPMAARPLVFRNAWVKDFIDNATARWNGNDAQNDARTWIVPRPASPAPPPLRTNIVTLFQYLKLAWAHFNVRTGDPGDPTASPPRAAIVSNMNGYSGKGQLRVNATIHDGVAGGNDAWGIPQTKRGLASAHELGHCGSLPDEYENNGKDSPMYLSLNILGSPYKLERLENQALMFYNWFIRARYLWHAAEWMRLLTGLGAVNFKLEHKDSAAPGPVEDDFYLRTIRTPEPVETLSAGLFPLIFGDQGRPPRCSTRSSISWARIN